MSAFYQADFSHLLQFSEAAALWFLIGLLGATIVFVVAIALAEKIETETDQ